jgi:LuxR family maltose regulon positive regulatory protein
LSILDEAWQQGKADPGSTSAGYGKTTLVTQWLRGRLNRWLSLDKADNDPARFLAYLIAALKQIDECIGENTRAMLQSPQPLPPELILTTLVNEIALVPTPFILVLDDYHAIEALPIHQQLDFLVEHQPPQMHLVLLTREDPPLPLARLRARAQMAEIRQDDLRFSPEECADDILADFELEREQDEAEYPEEMTHPREDD